MRKKGGELTDTTNISKTTRKGEKKGRKKGERRKADGTSEIERGDDRIIVSQGGSAIGGRRKDPTGFLLY